MKVLIIIIMVVSAVAMPAWIVYGRQRGRRSYWLWLAMLMPSAIVLSVIAMRLPIHPIFENNPVILYAVVISVVSSVSAFFGGLLYFCIPFIWKHTVSHFLTGVAVAATSDTDNDNLESEPPGGHIANGGAFTHGGDFVNGGSYTTGGPYG